MKNERPCSPVFLVLVWRSIISDWTIKERYVWSLVWIVLKYLLIQPSVSHPQPHPQRSPAAVARHTHTHTHTHTRARARADTHTGGRTRSRTQIQQIQIQLQWTSIKNFYFILPCVVMIAGWATSRCSRSFPRSGKLGLCIVITLGTLFSVLVNELFPEPSDDNVGVACWFREASRLRIC